MSKTPQTKQYALIEACRKAGIDVTVRDPNAPFPEIFLTDENGRRYKVSKNLKVEPILKHSVYISRPLNSETLIKYDAVGMAQSKIHDVIVKPQQEKSISRKRKKHNIKFEKLKNKL